VTWGEDECRVKRGREGEQSRFKHGTGREPR